MCKLIGDVDSFLASMIIGDPINGTSKPNYPKITFVNRRINKVKYHKPNGEAVGLKDREKLKNAKTN